MSATTTSRRTRERQVRRAARHVPDDGSRLTDPALGYLIAGFTDRGEIAGPGEAFYTAMWSRDLSGRCAGGSHQACAHSVGGRQEHGAPVTGADGRPHTWRCGCECHTGAQPQAYNPGRNKWLPAPTRTSTPAQLALF
jgi:hypothetical protein